MRKNLNKHGRIENGINKRKRSLLGGRDYRLKNRKQTLFSKIKELVFDSSQKMEMKMTKISGTVEAIYSYDSLGFELNKEELEKQMIEMVQKYQYLDCFNIRNKYKGKFTVVDKIYENSSVYVYLNFYPKYPCNMYIEIRIDALEWNIPVILDPNTNKLANMEDFEYESDSD